MTATVSQSTQNIVDQIISLGVITADDVAVLRREMFSDGIVDRDEAETVFKLESACPERDEAWKRFYVEALTDYFVWHTNPRGHVSEGNARFLVHNVMHDRRIDGETELELMVNIVTKAEAAPVMLKVFVLEAVRDSVLNAETAVYGNVRTANVIDPVDIEILGKVIYAGSSGGGSAVTRREAELIFDLHRATANNDNAPECRDLFVKSIANYLMFPLGAPETPTVEEVQRREGWLNERRGARGLLRGLARAFVRGDVSVGESWSAVDPTGARSKREAEMREQHEARDAANREMIDEDEAEWLRHQVGDQDPVHENIRALLRFIKQNAPMVHRSLDPLFGRAGI